jgi:hypothetical protein
MLLRGERLMVVHSRSGRTGDLWRARRDMTAFRPCYGSSALAFRAKKGLDSYSGAFSFTGCGGTVSGAGGAAEPSFRCRFSSFFCFLMRSLWRLANA